MADLRPQYTEEAVGANHPTKADTINRAYNVEHDVDGTHKAINPDSVCETTPCTIRGLNKEVLAPDTAALSALQCSGTIINNYGMANADAIIDLPAAASGLSFLVVLGAARAHYYRLRCLNAANDKIYLNGVAGSDDGYVGIATAVVGASISFFAFQTGAGVYDWFAITISGEWIAG